MHRMGEIVEKSADEEQAVSVIAVSNLGPFCFLPREHSVGWAIGYLGATTAAAERSRTDAFVQRFGELGWIEGHTIAIEYRSGEGREIF
jgi:hypothetical protein